ncbi:spore coat protein U domain-containing protein [Ramlibacter sp.]|uniref:spore coat protein U domain-containing protein n=1 Tax=Ramlibacter sp. TaxID=1917967 RepID=UPI002D3FA002|nr:spore coat protein U domain-containing protein [Ramlibacter sp.]HYD75652.1 spore coat protein U domain-containing protein [Ramlibacter sp.]
MSQLARIRIAAAIAVAALPLSSAFALDMVATASITGACSLTSVAPMPFGSLDQITGGAVPKTSTAVYACTNGVTPTVSVGGATDGSTGFSGLLAKGTDTIAYTVKWTNPGAATGFSTPVNLTLNGEIPAGAYEDKPAGSYTQTVAVTIAP